MRLRYPWLHDPTLATTYERWVRVARSSAVSLSEDERCAVYRLGP